MKVSSNHRKSCNKTVLTKKKLKNESLAIDNLAEIVTIKVILEPQDSEEKKIIKLPVKKFIPFKQFKVILKKNVYSKIKDHIKVVGFQSTLGNLNFDYRLQIGEGYLTNDLTLICLLEEKQKHGIQKYKICQCLAVGGFSKVFLVRSKINGEFYAAKFIDKSKNNTVQRRSLIENQKIAGQTMDHPFIVKTREFIETQKFFILIMDYCPGGELFYFLKQRKNLTEQQAKFCFIEILLGLEGLHSKGYMFRDLKPQNIMIDKDGHLKITDFGLVKKYKNKSYSFCGSLQYMAPEIIIGNGHSKFVDYYCLGALLFEMLIGHPPFYNKNSHPNQTKLRILQSQVFFPQEIDLSSQVKNIISKLLIKKQNFRLGYFGGSKQIFCHPWIGKINYNKYLSKEVISPLMVNLDKNNFDPEQIGQSQRIFKQRIEQEIRLIRKKRSQPKKKNENRKLSYQILNKTAVLACKPRASYQNMQTHSNQKPNPYKAKVLKNFRSFQKFYKQIKTQTNQEHSLSKSKYKLAENIRFTENHKQNYNKGYLDMYDTTKIKRKCKNNHKSSKIMFKCL